MGVEQSDFYFLYTFVHGVDLRVGKTGLRVSSGEFGHCVVLVA